LDINGKVCLITGASGGIGEALAYELADKGASVVLFARRAEDLERVSSKIGDQAAISPGDVTSAGDLRKAVDVAVDRFGGLDVLINNAGVAVMAHLSDVPEDLIERGYRTNVFGPIFALQAALPEIEKRGGGMIVNVSSAMSLRPNVSMAIYSSTKAALNVLSASMRLELKDKNISVMTVHPGFIGNDFGKNTLAVDEELVEQRRVNSQIRSSRTSDDAAKDIVKAMENDEAVFRSTLSTPLEMPL
jgi:NAD(P)-dependent dehydrogenase (short-subunit alcohol dehydrogenase family)